MKLNPPIPVSEIAELTGSRILGPADAMVEGLNEIHKVQKGDLMFVDLEKYFHKALASAAGFVLLNQEVAPPPGKTLLLHPEPFRAYNQLVNRLMPKHPLPPASGFVHPDAQVGPGTLVYPGAYVDSGVEIGADCVIYPNATIYKGTRLGDRVIVHANTTLGADAFYYKKFPTHFEKWTSCGRVLVGDEVEIGANCTIDKGVSGDTLIGKGCKLDNHIHLGHGVELGERCLFAAQVGIGGKTIIEDEVVLLGQVGVVKSIRIGRGATVLSGSGVSKSLEGGKVYFGRPAREAKLSYREAAALRLLPNWMDEIEAKLREMLDR